MELNVLKLHHNWNPEIRIRAQIVVYSAITERTQIS